MNDRQIDRLINSLKLIFYFYKTFQIFISSQNSQIQNTTIIQTQ